MALEFHLFLPQMRMSIDQLTERALAAEAAGFDGLALMDHLAPPMAEDQPMYEAIATAGWLLAKTSTLTVSHLVLCDGFRHPAILAKQAVTLDHASNGRFELGLGWGSVPAEFDMFGVFSTEAKARVARLSESLQIITALWAGEPVDFEGTHQQLRGASQQPTPQNIPIIIGGSGPRTLALVRDHASWWNCPIHQLDRFDELRDSVGDARPSIQTMVTFAPDPATRDDVLALADRRFGAMSDQRITGDADAMLEGFAALESRGVQRVYTWMSDFADPDNLARFGDEVIAPNRR
jgi:alkanesulfonate monooxygenase SsuD/methylene tetrahydromethanopterin reductase-like flavin-dependent oxidoreductase (luciferase family)